MEKTIHTSIGQSEMCGQHTQAKQVNCPVNIDFDLRQAKHVWTLTADSFASNRNWSSRFLMTFRVTCVCVCVCVRVRVFITVTGFIVNKFIKD